MHLVIHTCAERVSFACVSAPVSSGHTLGMSHDSSGNSCPSSGYIMASVAGVGTHFSSCSIKYTDTWVATNRPAPTCLADVPYVWLNADSEIATSTPGANVTTKAQQHALQQLVRVAPASEPIVTVAEVRISPWTLGLMCFLGGIAAAFALQSLARKLHRTSRMKAAVMTHLKSSPSPPAVSLHIAPSAPSTPIATHAQLASAAAAIKSDEHPTQHLTRAKRRASFTLAHGVATSGDAPRIPDTIPSESPE